MLGGIILLCTFMFGEKENTIECAGKRETSDVGINLLAFRGSGCGGRISSFCGQLLLMVLHIGLMPSVPLVSRRLGALGAVVLWAHIGLVPSVPLVSGCGAVVYRAVEVFH